MTASNHSAYLIERYHANRLQYFRGARKTDDQARVWVDDINDAVRFARECDAWAIQTYYCDSDGRVCEHVWVAP